MPGTHACAVHACMFCVCRMPGCAWPCGRLPAPFPPCLRCTHSKQATASDGALRHGRGCFTPAAAHCSSPALHCTALQTDCVGEAHYADWSQGGWHPRAFMPADMTRSLAVQAAGGPHCRQAAVAAMASAAQIFGAIPAQHVVHTAWLARDGFVGAGSNGKGGSSMHAAARVGSSRSGGGSEAVYMPSAIKCSEGSGGAACQHSGVRMRLAADASTMAGMANATRLRAWLLAMGYQPLPSARCHLAMRKVPEVCPLGTLHWAFTCSGLRLGTWCTPARS